MRRKNGLRARPSFRRLEEEWRIEWFTWVHRYLRLHQEMLDDKAYQDIYAHTRNVLAMDFKRQVRDECLTDEDYGELVDTFADLYGEDHPEKVNKRVVLVEFLYKCWVENH